MHCIQCAEFRMLQTFSRATPGDTKARAAATSSSTEHCPHIANFVLYTQETVSGSARPAHFLLTPQSLSLVMLYAQGAVSTLAHGLQHMAPTLPMSRLPAALCALQIVSYDCVAEINPVGQKQICMNTLSIFLHRYFVRFDIQIAAILLDSYH